MQNRLFLVSASIFMMFVIVVMFIVPRFGIKSVRSFSAHYHYKKTFFEQHGGHDFDVVFVGDNLTDSAEWSELFPSLKVANRGVNGDTIERISHRLESIYSTSASSAFLMMGKNDILAGKTVGGSFFYYKKIVLNLIKNGMYVYVQSTILTGNKNTDVNRKIIELNKKLREFTGNTNNAVYIDLNSELAPKSYLSDRYSLDGVYLNGTGYAIWKKLIKPYVYIGMPKYEVVRKIIYKKNVRGFPPYYYHRKSFFEQHGQSGCDIIFVGDSITDSAEWSELFPSQRVVNRGINGDTILRVSKRLDSIVSMSPKKVFIMVGVNDFFSGKSVKAVYDGYRDVVNILIGRGISVYIQSTLFIRAGINFPTERQRIDINSKVILLNKKMKEFSRGNTLATFVNINRGLSKDEKLRKMFTMDGIHLNGYGYTVWKKMIRKYVRPKYIRNRGQLTKS